MVFSLFQSFFTFFLFLTLILIIIYKLSPYLNDQVIFYLIFSYLCSYYIFMCLIQAPISSLQLTLLRIIYLNPGISRKEILKKYNSKHIFEERIRRLESSNIIYKNKSSFFLKSNKNNVFVEIKDYGPGIHINNFNKIFERFYTERPSHEKFGNHSGLGLSIVKQILDVHRGLIKVENRLDKNKKTIGAKFIITLQKII